MSTGLFEISNFVASPWLPAIVLIGLGWIGRQVRGSWLSPAAFVALIWAIYVPACLLLTDYEVYPAGLWVIVLFVFSVQFGTLLAEGLSPASRHQSAGVAPPTLRRWSNRSFTFSIAFTVVAMAGTVYLLIFSLDKYSLGFTPVELLSLGHLWSVDRYAGELEPWSVRLTIMWVYPAVLLAGICFATAQRRIHKALSFAPLVPAALIGTMFATRAGLLISAVCWFSGFVAVRYHRSRGRYALFKKKAVLSLAALVVCGFLFFEGIDAVRAFQGGDAEMDIRIDAPRIYKYFFGAVPAFSGWVHFVHAPDPTWGAYTFSGVFDLLGIRQRHIGVYDEMETLAGGEDTNIYTLFRGLIQDFTLAGACIFGVVLGSMAGTASSSRSGSSVGHVLGLAAFYALILFSPLSSLFVYNGLILAWVVAAFVLGLRPHDSRALDASHPVLA